MSFWANLGIICGALVTLGALVAMVGKIINWLWGRTLGQRVDSVALEVRKYAAEVRRFRMDQERWQRWHEERWHGYRPPPWSTPNGTDPTPTPPTAPYGAVRSHRR